MLLNAFPSNHTRVDLNQLVRTRSRKADPDIMFHMQTNAMTITPLLRRWNNRQKRNFIKAANATQLLTHERFFGAQLFAIRNVLPWTTATLLHVRTGRRPTLRRWGDQRHHMAYRIALFFFVYRDLNFIARSGSRNKNHLAIETTNTSWTVGKAINSEGNGMRRHAQLKNQKSSVQ